tara:strand:- start:593 stop:1270 length:678 start_codon:yes stop_codon:yes gene_type:complete
MIVSNINKINFLIEKSKVLIFDFDGVIVDSNDIKTAAFSELYQPYGSDVVNRVILHHEANGGMPRFEKFDYYHKHFLGEDINQKEIIDLSARFSKLVVNKVIAAPEINSAELFLKKIQNNKKFCSINSATPEVEIKEIIIHRNLEKYFSKILGSPSSKSENIIKILNYYKCNIKEALFFGDADSDINAALKTGIHFIGVGRSVLKYMHNRDETYYHINDFHEISK